MIYYVDGLKQAVAHTYTRSNTPSPARTTTTLRPAPQHLRPRVSNYLPAADGHTRRRTANSPPAASYGARAGRTPLADRSRCRRRPPTPRIPSPRSSKPSCTCARLLRPSVQRQRACNRHSSSVSTQIGSEIASQQGLAEHMVRTVPTGQEPASSSQARRPMPTGAAQPAAAKSAPSTYHTHPSAGKCSEKSTRFRHRRSRCSLPPDDGHSSWPGSRQLKPPVAPQLPHVTIRRIQAPHGSYCTTWPKKSHSCPERREGAKAGEIGLPQPHTKQQDWSGSKTLDVVLS